jgi:carbamoyltransferase
LVSAVEEERFRRIKHWAGFPLKSIEYCLSDHGISISDVDCIAINTDPSSARAKRLHYVLKGKSSFGLVLEKIRNRGRRASIKKTIESDFGKGRFSGKIIFVEHHMAHLASAFLVSPFKSATALSLDGFGDFASSAWAFGENKDISIEGRVYFPHSLGIFYQAMTQYLGFPSYGDEYKVMGLASYGKDVHVDEVSKLISLDSESFFRLDLSFFRHHRDRIGYEWNGGSPKLDSLFSNSLEDHLGPRRQPGDPVMQRHKDLAHSTQTVFENTFYSILDSLHQSHRTDNLVLSGGCAMNSVASGKIYKKTAYRNLYIPPAAGDAGGAVGAALVASTNLDNQFTRARTEHAYTGPGFSNLEIKEVIESEQHALTSNGCSVSELNNIKSLFARVVNALTKGNVVGWYQGRMEWGPRALGNRSILCDPRRSDIKEILNIKIKRRESFRPFAPSILREAVSEWFIDDDDVPFMEKVFEIKSSKQELIPAVTHVDGTGRLQTVTREANPRYYDLIKAFENVTGVPIILNTSFNENEPIVCEPQEALDCFLRTRMDMLVLNDFVIERGSEAPQL